MQQPLSHLYFLTVFEDLLKSKFNLSGLIKTAQNITKVCRPVKHVIFVYMYKNTFEP